MALGLVDGLMQLPLRDLGAERRPRAAPSLAPSAGAVDRVRASQCAPSSPS